MTEKIIGVYKITNTITGDFYIGSSKNVKERWANHKCQSTWKRFPNNPMYLDFQKYGLENFVFEVLEVVEPEELKEREQQFIELLKPTYNNYNAKGLDIERYKKSLKEAQKKYDKSDKGKEARKKASNKYQKSDKGKEAQKKAQNKYDNHLCCYNGETITLCALRTRFKRKGIINPTQEAKKYLIKKESKTPIEFYDVYP